MLARKIGIALLVSTFAVNVFAGEKKESGEKIYDRIEKMIQSEEQCSEVVDNHMQLIEDTEEYFSRIFTLSDTELTSSKIMRAQKVMKIRYDHLMKVLAKFHAASDCNMPNLGNVIAAYDFNTMAESSMKDKQTRRMIYSFTQAQDYGMESFKDQYNYFTRIDNIEKIRSSLTSSEKGLLEFFGLKINQDHSGTKMSTTRDSLKRVWNGIIGKGLIRTWGLLSDNLKVRSGYLQNFRSVRDQIQGSLKPLDLLFEQRRFVLSNLTIPGHWGHVAVWLGTKKELQALGLWDREDFAVFRKNVEQGKNIVNMRKEGVVFSSLAEFMNLDEVAVMRVNKVQIDPSPVYPLMAEQLNKKYDFSFDARTLGKITCTEFVSFSYGKIAWPTRLQMGRTVITPDDMAKLSLDSTQAHLVMYFGSNSDGPMTKTVKDWFEAINPQN